MKRHECLMKADDCICGQRQSDYGTPEDNFKKIAELWTAYKGVEFTALDVAMLMGLLKMARIKTGKATDDSFIDLAGYAACGCEIAENQPKPVQRVEIDDHAPLEQVTPYSNEVMKLLQGLHAVGVAEVYRSYTNGFKLFNPFKDEVFFRQFIDLESGKSIDLVKLFGEVKTK